MKTYILERDGKALLFGTENECIKMKDDESYLLALQGVPLDKETINTLNGILIGRYGAYREKSIVQDFGSIEAVKTPYEDSVINVYNKTGEGFQVFIRDCEHYKQGDITN